MSDGNSIVAIILGRMCANSSGSGTGFGAPAYVARRRHCRRHPPCATRAVSAVHADAQAAWPPSSGGAQCFLEGIIIHHRGLAPLRGLTDNLLHHSSSKLPYERQTEWACSTGARAELSGRTRVSVTQIRRHFLVQAAFLIERCLVPHAHTACPRLGALPPEEGQRAG